MARFANAACHVAHGGGVVIISGLLFAVLTLISAGIAATSVDAADTMLWCGLTGVFQILAITLLMLGDKMPRSLTVQQVVTMPLSASIESDHGLVDKPIELVTTAR